MTLKISVITATLNSATTITDAMSSLRDQTYPNVEHIVVDGLSDDATLEMVRSYSLKDTVIDARSDKGIYDALNRGIGLSSGDILGFLHSDDFFADDLALAKVAEAFADDSVDVCYGDLAYVSRENASRVVRRWRSGRFDRSKLRLGWMPPHPTLYVRRKLLDQQLFNLDYRISADYDFILKVFYKKRINAVYVPHELVHMRLGGASNMNLCNVASKMSEDLRVIKENQIGGLLTLVCKNVRKIPQLMVV